MKWKLLNAEFGSKCEKAKQDYSKNIVNDLKTSDPSQWYSKIKRMSSQDEEQEVEVQELMHLCPQDQAEKIADQFSGISNLYDPLQTSDKS